ncbi:pickpocket protein 28 [Drosophila innubila]|uniref:pickpocket protein 28 n=1 Tax=Drosophila innubila TaxID=198719 RepID=UPI00148B99BB|nr:pickpocket protein 28 [Drosophila innubila]
MVTIREREQRKLHQRLAVGHAVWWIPYTTTINDPPVMVRDEQTVPHKLSFAAALKDLLENLSFHCYGKLVEHGYRIQERLFWLIFHITALSVLIAFVWHTYKDNTEALVTTIYNPQYPVSDVDLPAISVCTMNRISNRAVWHYAQELSDKDPKLRNASFFYKELQAFGMYYGPTELGDYDRVLKLQGFLDVLDTEPDELFFNTRKRLRDLTPNCSDMFVSCRLAGKSFDCLRQFEESLTSYGFCCTFNLRGKYFKERPYLQRFFGADMGLALTLKSTPNDSFYKLHQRDGYPDPQSGGVSVRFVNFGENTHLPVHPKIFETVAEARQMSPTVRKCLFEDENTKLRHDFNRSYTFSKCISACRARSIFSLCGCLPFNIPILFIQGNVGRVFCTLQHMECLRRYKFKWLNVITSRVNMTGLEHELEDALYCPHCLASCTEIRYRVRGAMALALNGLYKPINSNNMDANNSYGHDSTELAVVRIYFAETHIQYFRQIIKNAWYEIFSTIGNICGIIAGFSLIGICELLFFLAKQLWHAYKTELKAELCHSHSHAHSQSQSHSRSRARANGRARETQQPMELLILP